MASMFFFYRIVLLYSDLDFSPLYLLPKFVRVFLSFLVKGGASVRINKVLRSIK